MHVKYCRGKYWTMTRIGSSKQGQCHCCGDASAWISNPHRPSSLASTGAKLEERQLIVPCPFCLHRCLIVMVNCLPWRWHSQEPKWLMPLRHPKFVGDFFVCIRICRSMIAELRILRHTLSPMWSPMRALWSLVATTGLFQQSTRANDSTQM